jgi:transposase-like protein
MRELSVAEQRHRAVLAVITDGRTVTETAAAVGVSRTPPTIERRTHTDHSGGGTTTLKV